MRRLPPLAILALLAATTTSAAAGAFPTCDSAPTATDAVAGADLVVVARAASATRRFGPDGLITSFVVVETLKGTPTRRRIAVTGCTSWKCSSERWRRGERALLLLRRSGGARYWLPGPSCGNGFTRAALADDPADVEVQAVRAAAATARP